MDHYPITRNSQNFDRNFSTHYITIRVVVKPSYIFDLCLCMQIRKQFHSGALHK